ncbi:hypothetical protein KUM39_07015 [Streptomyces sp. J2-1]|uniref:hypothetical protein n=1 Tax=Streptomyces corallincola TaxID=2851888 RepID=UPI001C382B6C|nr:hypothetical protein [Streptomyces corallincola]MBV2354115.1 hypothetical protein [Streptomyces corallincola]
MSKTRLASAVALLVLTASLSGCADRNGTAADGDGKRGGTASSGAPSSGTPSPGTGAPDSPSAGAPSDGGGASDGAGTSSVRAVRDAYRATVAAGSARMTLSTRVRAEGQALTAHGDGVADLASGASRITLTSQGASVEQRVLDGVLYKKPPAGAGRQAVPGGRTWLRIDLARLTGRADGLAQVTDPAAPVRYLKGLDGRNVTRTGTERLDGEPTTRYRVSVPVSALTRGATGPARELARRVGASTIPVDLWLDAEGRMRQESVRLALHPLKGRVPGHDDTTMTSTTVLRLSDFGTEAAVSAPPAADTADVTDRMLKNGGGTG